MPAKVALALAFGALVLSGCGSSATRDAALEAVAAAAIEVGAAALQAAADDASAREAAKEARRDSPSGNWRLVRQQDDDAECNEASADDDNCQTDSDPSDSQLPETDESGLSLGHCIVCQ